MSIPKTNAAIQIAKSRIPRILNRNLSVNVPNLTLIAMNTIGNVSTKINPMTNKAVTAASPTKERTRKLSIEKIIARINDKIKKVFTKFFIPNHLRIKSMI